MLAFSLQIFAFVSVMQFRKAMLMAFSGESGFPILQSSEER